MPTPEQVLSGLREIANTWRWLAIAWHAYLAVLVVSLTGVFYGVFGAVRLGVSLDWVLAAGAVWLVVAPLVLKRGMRAADPD